MALIKQRNNLKNIFARTKDTSLRPAINALTRQIASLMGQWKTAQWNEQLRRTHDDHRQLWRLLRSTVCKRRSVLLTDGDQLLSNAEQAELLATHYQQRDCERAATAPPLDPTPAVEPPDVPMYSTYGQLEAALRRTKSNKSSGEDNIPYVLLKMLPRKGKSYLLNICNSALRIGYFPKAWKHAIVVPLLKPARNGSSADHYRPISLLNHVSKIYEKLLMGHVMKHCEARGIVPPEQTGFMAGLSCEHHVAKVQSHASKELNRNRATAFISLDCTQAFDCVSHHILIDRMRRYEFPRSLVKTIEEYLRLRTFSVRVGDDVSTPRPTTCGVPQGSVLGPMLFTIYTAHVVALKFPEIQVAAYADDIGIYGTSTNAERALQRVQAACDSIVNALEAIGIKVNPSKTDAVVMSFQGTKGARQHGGLPKDFKIAGRTQAVSTRITYLGVKLERHLSITPHVNSRLKLARQKTYRLNHLIRSPNLSLRLKLQIYKAIIRPTLLHAAPSMRYMHRSVLRRLQAFQNGVLLRAVRNTSLQASKPDVLHTELNLPTVDEFIRRRHIKFYDGLQHCRNPLFRDVVPPQLPRRWTTELKPTRILDILNLH